MEFETVDKLKRARIQIQAENPFFAYLSLYLKFKESKKGELPEWAGCGVDVHGSFVYNKEFIDGLQEKHLKSIIVHEILHLSLLHLLRRGNRDSTAWNIAADICTNQILKENNFELPQGCIQSDYHNTVEIFGQKIENCDKKTVEQIFDEFKFKSKPKKVQGFGKNGFGGFDEHIEGVGDGKKKKKLSPEERESLEKEWKNKLEEAYVVAKMKGDVPAGIERLIGKIHKEQINWRSLLLRHIQAHIPYDYSYKSPHKKSVSSGFYMPNVTKDKIKVIVGIDTSGSIGQDELVDFLSEIIGMAKAFRNRVEVRILTHDVDVHNDYLADNGAIDKIKKIRIDGGGGTSHREILNYIDEKIRDCKFAIFFTDGYSDIDSCDLNKYKFDKLFVISKGGTDRQVKVKRQVIKLE